MNAVARSIKNMTPKQMIFAVLTLLAMVGSIMFVQHNYSWYDRPIAHVLETSVTETTSVTDRRGNEDHIYTQEIIAELKNGDHQGKQIRLINDYSDSGAYDHEFKAGNDVFVSIDKSSLGDRTLTGGITDVKRDHYLLIIVWIFFMTLLLVGRKQGLFAGISLAVNIILLSYALDIYVNTGVNLLLVCGLTAIIFTVLSLLLINGFNEKTYAAIVATLLGTGMSLLITFMALWMTNENGLRYEEMQFLTRPYTLVFLAGLFIGSLGAVMDVAISIAAALFELYEKNHNISAEALKKSGFDIGKDIMGTMTNILFFAYISGSIPMLIVYIKNFSPLDFTLSVNLSLELARALAGGIGIVLTIPIGLYTTLFFIERRRAKQ